MDCANKPKPPASKADAQDAVQIIVDLIDLHSRNHCGCFDEQIEIAKRALTDYLLAIDPRPGWYFKGPSD